MSEHGFRHVVKDVDGDTATVRAFAEDQTLSLWTTVEVDAAPLDLDSAAARELAKALTDAADLIDPPAADQTAGEVEWSKYAPRDDQYEYAVTSRCDGTDVRYWRFTPKRVLPRGPQEPATEEAYRAAVEATSLRDHDEIQAAKAWLARTSGATR
jgi:hypothetical protein